MSTSGVATTRSVLASVDSSASSPVSMRYLVPWGSTLSSWIRMRWAETRPVAVTIASLR